jgi:hypothetical protein
MGSTSADVNKGFGKPLQGQTSIELNHDGQHGRKKQTTGLEGTGASTSQDPGERQLPDQRGLEREEAVVSGTRGDKASRAAEEMNPESAETVSKEWKYEPSTKRDKGQQRRH